MINLLSLGSETVVTILLMLTFLYFTLLWNFNSIINVLWAKIILFMNNLHLATKALLEKCSLLQSIAGSIVLLAWVMFYLHGFASHPSHKGASCIVIAALSLFYFFFFNIVFTGIMLLSSQKLDTSRGIWRQESMSLQIWTYLDFYQWGCLFSIQQNMLSLLENLVRGKKKYRGESITLVPDVIRGSKKIAWSIRQTCKSTLP